MSRVRAPREIGDEKVEQVVRMTLEKTLKERRLVQPHAGD